MKVNILGAEYEIIEQSENENQKLEGANGICEIWSKKIVIESNLIEPHKMLVEEPERFKRKVLRHEIVHAFFAESGLLNYCHDETLIDFLAVQFPKMLIAMREAECL